MERDTGFEPARQTHFFRKDGPMPDAVELRLLIPPELGPRRRCSRNCGKGCRP